MYDANGGMPDDGGDDEDIFGGNYEGCYPNHNNGYNEQYSNQEQEKGAKVPKMKTVEIMLAAVYTLISAGLSVIKFIHQIGKLTPQDEQS